MESIEHYNILGRNLGYVHRHVWMFVRSQLYSRIANSMLIDEFNLKVNRVENAILRQIYEKYFP